MENVKNAKWYEISVTTTHEAADLVADLFFDLGGEGVSIRDKSDVEELYRSSVIWDYIDKKALDGYDDRVYVKFMVPESELKTKLKEVEEGLAVLKSRSPFPVGAAEIIANPVDDADWRNEWKKYYKPIVTKSVTVVPKWINYPKAEGEKLLYINPGMAFGTGEHETTHMCLDLLAECSPKGKTVIDVGTGSGILGIAAKICGAKSVYMCDIDAHAILTAKENAELNGVSEKCDIECADLLTKTDFEADVVLANITADVLIKLSKDIKKYVKDNGYLVVSGIINERVAEVARAFKAAGFMQIKAVNMGEWNAFLFKD